MTKAIYDEAAERALRLTSGIIGRYGPRMSGTEGCLGAAAEMEGLLEGLGAEVHRDRFAIHPGALYAIGKVFALSYLIGVASLVLGSMSSSKIFLYAGLIAMSLGAAFCVCQFILYLDVFDPLFKKVEGRNVVGSIEPSFPATRQVIVVAHLDSAPVYPFHERHAELYPLRLYLPIALFLLCLVALSISAASALFAAKVQVLPAWIQYLLVFGMAFVAPMYRFISKRAAPGAGDDLVGCAIGIEVARLFRSGQAELGHTRLVVLLADGEEPGQKGSKRYLSVNRESMGRIHTTVINIDNVYDYENLGLIVRDGNGMIPLSGKLARKLHSIASQRGHAAKIISIPLGGGGTDAAQFARKGIESVGIMADSTEAIRKEIVFHTMKDMPDKIQAEAVSAVIEVVCEYVAMEDAEAY
jgi:aminopeptidase YwaD